MSNACNVNQNHKACTSLIPTVAAPLGWRHATEVNLSPKPGLVDRINCGAHKDMALEDFPPQRAGIRLVTPVSLEFGACSAKWHRKWYSTDYAHLVRLAKVFRATAGVNTRIKVQGIFL